MEINPFHLKTKGAKHYYMEPHAAFAIPQERDEMLVYVTSQDLKAEQDNIAIATGIPISKISVKVRRVGGE